MKLYLANNNIFNKYRITRLLSLGSSQTCVFAAVSDEQKLALPKMLSSLLY